MLSKIRLQPLSQRYEILAHLVPGSVESSGFA